MAVIRVKSDGSFQLSIDVRQWTIESPAIPLIKRIPASCRRYDPYARVWTFNDRNLWLHIVVSAFVSINATIFVIETNGLTMGYNANYKQGIRVDFGPDDQLNVTPASTDFDPRKAKLLMPNEDFSKPQTINIQVEYMTDFSPINRAGGKMAFFKIGGEIIGAVFESIWKDYLDAVKKADEAFAESGKIWFDPTNYYSLLRVGKKSSTSEIKRAWGKLIKQAHPDYCKDPNAGRVVDLLCAAKNTLCDAKNRALYDADLSVYEKRIARGFLQEENAEKIGLIVGQPPASKFDQLSRLRSFALQAMARCSLDEPYVFFVDTVNSIEPIFQSGHWMSGVDIGNDKYEIRWEKQ